MEVLPEIRNGFTNIYGKHFPHVKEIAFFSDIHKPYKFGNFITETKREKTGFFGGSDDITPKVWIYQNRDDENICYRIYQNCLDYGYNGEHDDELIEELLKHQDNIKLTKFPTGVITIDGRIVGQEMKFYKNEMNLYELFIKKEIKTRDVIRIYRAVYRVLKEMLNSGITYIDNHAKNFMLNPNLIRNPKINTIDFMNSFIKFGKLSPQYETALISNFCNMVNILNRLQCIDYELYDISIDRVEDIPIELDIMEMKLRKQR